MAAVLVRGSFCVFSLVPSPLNPEESAKSLERRAVSGLKMGRKICSEDTDFPSVVANFFVGNYDYRASARIKINQKKMSTVGKDCLADEANNYIVVF